MAPPAVRLLQCASSRTGVPTEAGPLLTLTLTLTLALALTTPHQVSLLGLGAFASFLVAKNGLLITSAAEASQGNLSGVPPGDLPLGPAESSGELSGETSTWTVVIVAAANAAAMAVAICLRLLTYTVADPSKAQRVGARGWTALVLLGLAIVALVAATSPVDPTVAGKAQAASSPLISAASPLELLELAWVGLAPPLMGFLMATINGNANPDSNPNRNSLPLTLKVIP